MVATIIIFIFTLVILMFVHELGHFLMAKKFNIKVLEFGFGFPPKVWGKKIGETLVSINLLPIGAFVRLLGEDDVDKKMLEDHRSFASQKVIKRIGVVLAGVVMNLLLAWLLFYIVLGFQGFKTQFPLFIDHKFIGVEQTNQSQILIENISKGSPADLSGLKVGEKIVALNDQPITISQQLINETKSFSGQEIKLTVQEVNSDIKKEIAITPRQNPPKNEGPLGVSLAQVRMAEIEFKTPLQKLFAGPVHSWNIISYSGIVFGNLINKSFVEKNLGPVSGSVSGPVGITSIANGILTGSQNPLLPYLEFVALISLNLAVFNLLPIPALDGGRLFFLIIELVIGKRVHAGFEKWVHTAGMVLLLALSVLVTFSDIKKFF